MTSPTAAPEQTIKLADRHAECHVTGCHNPATHLAVPLAGKSRKPFVTCEDCKPGSKRPVDAPWPMCFTVAPL